MLINLKYYLVFLIIFFLTLGIGIFIGLNMNSYEFLDSQRTTLVNEIEQEFITLRNQNNDLLSKLNVSNNEKKMYHDLSHQLFENYILGRLDNKNICIIELDNNWIYTDIAEMIEKAGANITTVISINSYEFDEINKLEQTDKNGQSNIFDKLIHNLCLFSDTKLLEQLKSSGIINLSNIPVNKSDILIFACGNKTGDTKIENFIQNMIKSAKNYNITCVGIEKTDVEHSMMYIFKRERISTVDNVDQIFGSIALIEILSGAKGNFGFKDYADRLLPEKLLDIQSIDKEDKFGKR